MELSGHGLWDRGFLKAYFFQARGGGRREGWVVGADNFREGAMVRTEEKVGERHTNKRADLKVCEYFGIEDTVIGGGDKKRASCKPTRQARPFSKRLTLDEIAEGMANSGSNRKSG